MMTQKKIRCFEGQDEEDIYTRYHDEEWGVPVFDDRTLFEMLVLEGAQSGLSWRVILSKREAYRRGFFNFDLERVSAMKDADLEAMVKTPLDIAPANCIVRHPNKIWSVRQNARVCLDVKKDFGSLATFFWGFVGGAPQINHWQTPKEVPSQSKESVAMSQKLKALGASFVGPVTMYSMMQATGMINDHLVDCWIRQ